MEQVKKRFMNDIAARLAGAAESDAKSEMIEELAENLAGRYGDMVAAGTPEGEAYARAMEQLGDADELTAYLNSLEPEEDRAASADRLEADLDELVRSLGTVGRQVAEGAVKTARDAIRKLKQSGVRWNGQSVTHIDIDRDGNVSEAVFSDGRTYRSGAPEIHFETDGAGGEQAVPSQGIYRLDIETAGGDVDLFLDEDPNSLVRLKGNMSRMDVFVTEDGVLTVRPRSTASVQFFTFRGVSTQDVSLTVPARRWESIRVCTGNGDVDMGGALEVERLTVQTTVGDVDCRVRSCQQAELKAISGDVSLEGSADQVRIETANGDISCRLQSCWKAELRSASGDVTLTGGADELLVKSYSGDVALTGPVGRTEAFTASGDISVSGPVGSIRASTYSGDIDLESITLPQGMELSSKSGDVSARIPDSGPFQVQVSSVSGSVDLRPFKKWSGAEGADPGAPVPQYTLTSISGDVSLSKY